MRSIDVFNGDADGICALHQLRLHTPRPGAQLVTGVKRDIRLLRRVEEVVGCQLTVLDISSTPTVPNWSGCWPVATPSCTPTITTAASCPFPGH